MSRLLGLAFDPGDLPALDAFAAGREYDALLLTGAPGPSAAARVHRANLAEVPPADAVDAAVAEFARGYGDVFAVSSMRSKDLLPRLAQRLDAAPVTDVLRVLGPGRFLRPNFAGAVNVVVEAEGRVVLTFRPAGFAKVAASGVPESADVALALTDRTRRIQASAKQGARPGLDGAEVVVSGGRPLKTAENFERLIGGLADALGGAVGATRAAVDSDIAPNEAQVGQTGKIVAPNLYIAAGVSGSTQHMAGIKDSKIIVAINNDPNAAIFEVADLGLVADLHDAIPRLIERRRAG